MKTTYIILPALAAVAMLSTSCDEISENDRYIEMGAVEVKRAVLIEDFTGQNCPNCPSAHERIEELVAQYGDAVIPVSIHAGKLSYPIANKRRNGLGTETGNLYDGTLPPHNYPAIVLDGNKDNVYNGIDNEWVGKVRELLQIQVPVELECKASYTVNPEGVKTIDIATDIRPYEVGTNTQGTLQVWIIENDIVGYQSTLTGAITDYVHQNVFRAAANGVWGQPISMIPNIFSTIDTSYTITGEWEETWNLDNVDIVAFITTGGSVIQATRTKLVAADSAEETAE